METMNRSQSIVTKLNKRKQFCSVEWKTSGYSDDGSWNKLPVKHNKNVLFFSVNRSIS